MAMIQLEMDDLELQDLLERTGTKAGTKALRLILDDYNSKLKELELLKQEHNKLSHQYRELDYKSRQFSELLGFFSSRTV
jgi:cell shape-determining protein MreC